MLFHKINQPSLFWKELKNSRSILSLHVLPLPESNRFSSKRSLLSNCSSRFAPISLFGTWIWISLIILKNVFTCFLESFWTCAFPNVQKSNSFCAVPGGAAHHLSVPWTKSLRMSRAEREQSCEFILLILPNSYRNSRSAHKAFEESDGSEQIMGIHGRIRWILFGQ